MAPLHVRPAARCTEPPETGRSTRVLTGPESNRAAWECAARRDVPIEALARARSHPSLSAGAFTETPSSETRTETRTPFTEAQNLLEAPGRDFLGDVS